MSTNTTAWQRAASSANAATAQAEPACALPADLGRDLPEKGRVLARLRLGTYDRCYTSPRLVAHIDAAIRHHLLNIAQAEREVGLQPDRVLNHGGWEAVPFVGNSRHWPPSESRYSRL